MNDVPPSPTATPDDGPAHHEHGSPVVRAFFFVAGTVAFTLAIAGVLLPLLPATPLFILAAACFARAYRPFHEWMLGHRWLGPMLKEWYQHGSVPYRTKVVAIATMLVSFGLSILLVFTQPWLQALLAMTALALATWLYRIPSRDVSPRRWNGFRPPPASQSGNASPAPAAAQPADAPRPPPAAGA